MSLIITSSTQDRYTDNDFAVENAFSYKNYMSNSIKIPKHSAVCVQSVKFSRRGSFVIKDDDYTGYCMIGKDHDKVSQITDSNPMTMIEFKLAPGEYSVAEIAPIIQTAINKSVNVHPDYKSVEVATKHTSGKWDGFEITTEQKDQPTNQVALIKAYPIISPGNDEGPIDGGPGMIPYNRPAVGTATPQWTGGLMNAQSTVAFTADTTTYSYAANVGTFHCGATGAGEATNVGWSGMFSPVCPISLQKGGYTVTCNGFGGSLAGGRTVTSYLWYSALTRPQAVGYDATTIDGQWKSLAGLEMDVPPTLTNPKTSGNQYGGWTMCGDYWCGTRLDTTTGKYALRVGYFGYRVGQAGVAPLDPNIKNDEDMYPFEFMSENEKGGPANAPTEIEYWKATGTNVKTLTAAYDMGLNANGYSGFRWEVKGEVINLFAIKADLSEDFVIDITQDANYKFPVINQNKVRLYPKLMIGNEIEGAGTSTLTITNAFMRDMSEHAEYVTSIDHYGTGFYESNIDARGKAWEVDRRGFSDPDWTYTPIGLLAADVINNVTQWCFERTADVQPEFLVLMPEANVKYLLGFEKAFVNTGVAGAGRGEVTITSAVVPTTSAEHSLFIRCPTLTQQSQNFGKGSMSKIIHHIPMFDNTGKSTGSLFFENAHPMYLRLGNTEEITLNEIQIDIVDRNEKYAYEIDGSTIVVLHIKPESQI